jgi:lipopolysaccharide transport system ATP-binding protein
MPGFKKPEKDLQMSCNDFAVKVNLLGKCFEIYNSPHDRLKQFLWPRLDRIINRPTKNYYQEFWALKNVSFEVKRGDTVGIIGRNGSGKSTLLQMICGTLTPTTGTVETTGRIAALLELGSGFNPEFTGRENVYMNATMLGLNKAQIDNRFEDIQSFADIGRFIDQPVKTYSSGMYVRLAFSVIAHVDADILVVDEALSVGDAIFTQKCMRFIRKFKEKGTLIFVSHDTSSIQNICESGIWLKNGRIEMSGTAKNVSEAYLQYTYQEIYGDELKLHSISSNDFENESRNNDVTPKVEIPSAIDYGAIASVNENIELAKGWKTGQAEIISVSLSCLSRGNVSVFEGGEIVRMKICAKTYISLENPILGFLVRDRLGQDLFGENTLPFTDCFPTRINEGEIFEGVFDFYLPMLPNGQYAVMASVADGNRFDNIQHHWLHDALIFTVSSSRVRYGLVGIKFEKVMLEKRIE